MLKALWYWLTDSPAQARARRGESETEYQAAKVEATRLKAEAGRTTDKRTESIPQIDEIDIEDETYEDDEEVVVSRYKSRGRWVEDRVAIEDLREDEESEND